VPALNARYLLGVHMCLSAKADVCVVLMTASRSCIACSRCMHLLWRSLFMVLVKLWDIVVCWRSTKTSALQWIAFICLGHEVGLGQRLTGVKLIKHSRTCVSPALPEFLLMLYSVYGTKAQGTRAIGERRAEWRRKLAKGSDLDHFWP